MSTAGGSSAAPEWDLILSASMKNNVQEIDRLISQYGASPNHCNGELFFWQPL